MIINTQMGAENLSCDRNHFR